MREEGVIDEASGEKGTSKEKAVQRGMKEQHRQKEVESIYRRHGD